jgi:cell wall assembly regulator SMI1
MSADGLPDAGPVRDGDEVVAGTAAGAPSPPLPPPATARGKRIVLLLAGAFVSLSLVVCGLAYGLPGQAVHTEVTVTPVTGHRAPAGPMPVPHIPATQAPRPRSVADICPQYRDGVIPVEPDRATTARVTAAWKRIEVWLAAKAPASRRSLGPPAAAKEISAAQRRMSVAFPADLVASLRRHDGVTDRGTGFTFPFFYEPMTVGRIADEWLMLCTSLADVYGAADSGWWDRALVPFASSGDGGNLHVDQRPGGHGRVGEFYNEDGVSYHEWPGSIAELLEQTADSLETGRPFRNRYRPTVTGQGVLEWDVI